MQLHILQSGVLTLMERGREPVLLTEPSIIFTLRSDDVTFRTHGAHTSVVSAPIQFNSGLRDHLVRTLPQIITVKTASAPEFYPAVELLVAETRRMDADRQAALGCLAEYLVLLLLRTVLRLESSDEAGFRAFRDPQLGKVLVAIQDQPEFAWSLESLARIAGMSRSRFAAHFLAVVGQTPFEYLAALRISVAQRLLMSGESLKIVAPAVGYSSPEAFSRAFSQRVGSSPARWISREVPVPLSRKRTLHRLPSPSVESAYGDSRTFSSGFAAGTSAGCA